MQLLLVVIILLFLTLIPKLVSVSLLRRKTKTNVHTHTTLTQCFLLSRQYKVDKLSLEMNSTSICKFKSWYNFHDEEYWKQYLFSFCFRQMLLFCLIGIDFCIVFSSRKIWTTEKSIQQQPLTSGLHVTLAMPPVCVPSVFWRLKSHTCLSFGNTLQREMLGGEKRVGLMGSFRCLYIHWTLTMCLETF